MVIKISTFKKYLLFFVIFSSFLGYYALVLFLVNIGMGDTTRSITIPFRGLLGFALILLFLFSIRNFYWGFDTFVYVIFSLLFVSRIFLDYLQHVPFYLSTFEVLFYFISFSIIPFLCISTLKLSKVQIRVVFLALISSGFIFSLLSFFLYRQYIGQVARLASETVGEEVVSPLILSYCATLTIGVALTYLLFNKCRNSLRIILIISIAVALVPFFLGASRGSILALFIPFIFIYFQNISLSTVIRGLLFFVFIGGILIYLDGVLGSGLLNRFTGISKSVEEGSSSASRLTIWSTSLNQFFYHPIIGDKLAIEGRAGYPHNLFVEVLQTTGIMGMIPFTILVVSTWRKSYRLVRIDKASCWIVVVFIQAFVQNMFSGSLYTAAWFWTSMALVIAIYRAKQYSFL